MEQKHDPDGIGTVAQLAALQLNGTVAMKELEATTKLCQSALRASANSYEQLLTQFMALKETAQAGAKGHGLTAELEEAQKYVLVLIDAHSHTFADSFLRGEATADVIKNIVKNILERRRPELAALPIVAKVYANFENLSQHVSLQHRSKKIKVVQTLAQKFSSANPQFDFVNVAHNALVEKIIAVFNWHNEDPRCANILLSTAVHKNYDEMLSKHPDYKNKITDIPTAMADDISETVEAEGETKATVSHSPEKSSTPIASPAEAADPEKAGSPHIQGQYGHFENSRYVAPTPPNVDVEASNTTIQPRQDRRSSQAGLIPVNAAGQRIDTFLRPPTYDEDGKYKIRTKVKKLCALFHLTGSCNKKNCRFDHSAITPTILDVLRHKLKECPCVYAGRCRQADCIYGHVCFAKGCSGRRHPGCKFSLEAHVMDLKIFNSVKPGVMEEPEVVEVEVPAGPYGKATKEEVKDNSWFRTGGSKASMEIWPAMVQDLIEI